MDLLGTSSVKNNHYWIPTRENYMNILGKLAKKDLTQIKCDCRCVCNCNDCGACWCGEDDLLFDDFFKG